MAYPADHYLDAASSDPEVRTWVGIWEVRQSSADGGIAWALRWREVCLERPDTALAVVFALAKGAGDEAERVAIAEEFEGFLATHGSGYWEVVNALCVRSDAFRAVVANVWGTGLSKDLRRKVEMWRS